MLLTLKRTLKNAGVAFKTASSASGCFLVLKCSIQEKNLIWTVKEFSDVAEYA